MCGKIRAWQDSGNNSIILCLGMAFLVSFWTSMSDCFYNCATGSILRSASIAVSLPFRSPVRLVADAGEGGSGVQRVSLHTVIGLLQIGLFRDHLRTKAGSQELLLDCSKLCGWKKVILPHRSVDSRQAYSKPHCFRRQN